MIDAGVDVVSHACLLAYQASPEMPRAYHNRPPVDETLFANNDHVLDPLFANMKERGTILDATLYVYDVMWKVPNAQPPPYCSLALAEKIAAEAHRAGVMISAGTDAPGDWSDPYPSLYQELSLLVHHAGHGGAAHIGTGRVRRRDLQHRGADIGGHDQQGENPTQQIHRHPLSGTAPAGSDQGG